MWSRLNNKKIFGFRLVTEEDYQTAKEGVVQRANLTAENSDLRKDVHKLRNQVAALTLEAEVASKMKEVIDPFMGDPSPVDREQRRLYVAQVAGLYKEILEPKFKQMIAHAHAMLEEASNDREYDQAVKGTVYALREILRWGMAMVNEQVAFQSQTEEENNQQ